MEKDFKKILEAARSYLSTSDMRSIQIHIRCMEGEIHGCDPEDEERMALNIIKRAIINLLSYNPGIPQMELITSLLSIAEKFVPTEKTEKVLV